MRKLTVEMEPDEEYTELMKEAFQKIESYEILEALKINYEEGICVDLIKVITRPGISIEDVKSIDKMEIINVIKSDGNKHTCLGKYFEKEENGLSRFSFSLDWAGFSISPLISGIYP